MACGCSKGNGLGVASAGGVEVKYVYTDPRGRQFSYDTKYEANYAQMREGGGGNIRTEPK